MAANPFEYLYLVHTLYLTFWHSWEYAFSFLLHCQTYVMYIVSVIKSKAQKHKCINGLVAKIKTVKQNLDIGEKVLWFDIDTWSDWCIGRCLSKTDMSLGYPVTWDCLISMLAYTCIYMYLLWRIYQVTGTHVADPTPLFFICSFSTYLFPLYVCKLFVSIPLWTWWKSTSTWSIPVLCKEMPKCNGLVSKSV